MTTGHITVGEQGVMPEPGLSKAAYFAQLYALNDVSDDENEACDNPKFFKKINNVAFTSSSSSFNSQQQHGHRRSPKPPHKAPALQRNNSAPVSDAAPLLIRKPSLLRHGASTPLSESSFSGQSPLANPASTSSSQQPEQERRTVSDPSSRGSLVLKNSTGIETMLHKRQPQKQKRKRNSFTLVPEYQRFFQGLRFFFLPADDISPVRKLRINKARSYGATWEKELHDGVTHVIADKSLTYQNMVSYLKSNFSTESLPKNSILVNELYLVDCFDFRRVLEPDQGKYEIPGSRPPTPEQAAIPVTADKTSELDPSLIKPSEAKSQKQTHLLEDSPLQTREVDGQTEARMDSRTPIRAKGCPSYIGYNDALDEMIELAQRTAHLPSFDGIDDDEDSHPPSNSSQNAGDSDDSDGTSPARAPKRHRKARAPKGALKQENFACMRGSTGITTSSNPNARTIEILQEMGDIYERIQDRWRLQAYRKAISTLKAQTQKISTYDDAIVLPTIGHRIALKIDEIVETDSLRRLVYAKNDPHNKVLSVFTQIYDVALKQASAWISQGHRTLDDLKAHANLTKNQKIGIEHYDDFNTRIPRDQVTALGEIVKKAAVSIDPEVELTIGGSYRRSAPTSGDIDFIISKPGTTSTTPLISFLENLVTDLTESGFLVAALAVPTSDTASKWHGACVLPENPIWRRIDFLLVPASEMGAALIYFTGDDMFNKSIRLLAYTKGWRLNQRGLYRDVLRGPERAKLTDGELIEGADEKKIFDALGVPYRPPEYRILH